MYDSSAPEIPHAHSLFHFAFERLDGRIVVSLSGELDVVNARRLRESFAAVRESDEHELIVDMSDVSFIDSACLAVLVWAANRCREHGRQLILRRPTRRVVSALAASGLLRSFRYDESSLDGASPWPTRLPAEGKRETKLQVASPIRRQMSSAAGL